MIGYLQGKILEIGSESAVILCQGVGYDVQVPALTLAEMEGRQNQEAKLWVHTHVREDALSLFGFLSKKEKELFLQLLKVNGVGPKMAMNIMSGATYDQVIEMIETEDVKALSKLPKVGKKTAEQMILTLKGKLVLGAAKEIPALANKPKVHKELASALVNLGFRSQDVDRVLATMPKDLDLEGGLKTALSALTNI